MKKFILAPVLAIAIIATGCSVAWLSTFEGYLKVAGPILVQILDIVSLVKGTPVNSSLQAKITADAAAANTIAQSISSASSQNVQGDCAQFNLAVSTLQGDLSQVEQLANVGSQTSAEISAAMGIAQAAFTEIEAPIAACQSAPTPSAALNALKAGSVGVSSPEDVVRKYNAIVDSKHKVHLHNKFVRALTFGHLQ